LNIEIGKVLKDSGFYWVYFALKRYPQKLWITLCISAKNKVKFLLPCGFEQIAQKISAK
jgi:hypothetical protein